MKEAETRFTTEALVIREQRIGESDRLVTLFTRENGLLRAFASGAKSIKSKRGAATALLTYGSFTIQKRKDTFRITEASPIRVFFGAGSDIEVLTLAQYFCELSEVFVSAGVSDGEFLRLILNSLHFLTQEKRYPPLIKALTELRAAAISGYSPNLIACDTCGKFEDTVMFFDLSEGSIFCQEHKQEAIRPVAIDATLLSAMRHILYSDFSKLYAFTIPNEAADRLSDITGQYLTYQTDHRFTALDFYDSVRGK